MPRVDRPRCGAVVTMVPWAEPGSRFTRDSESECTWLMSVANRKTVSGFLHVAWRTAGDIVRRVADRLRADQAYASGLRTLATAPGGPWFPGLRASVASWLPGFRWDPMGPMTWPDIYVYVEAYYRKHPEQELWRSQALESNLDPRTRSTEVVRVVEAEPKTDFPWQDLPADKG